MDSIEGAGENSNRRFTSSKQAPLADSIEWQDSGEISSNNQKSDSLTNDDDAGICLQNEEEANDGANALAYLQKYGVAENVSERQSAVRHLVKTLQAVEDDEAAVHSVFYLVQRSFAEDADPIIRAELLEQVPLLSMHCCQSVRLEQYKSNVLLPLLVKFLNDANTQVRKTCQAAVSILLEQGLLTSDDIEHCLFPVLFGLSVKDCNADDVRIESVGLLCKLVPSLGRDKTISLFLNRFTELCVDSLFHIRKTCAAYLGDMSKALGRELTERILVPHLIALSQDGVWGVRKACAECFTEVSGFCSMQTRRHQLAPVFIVLLADSSRWVQSSAFQALGPFISTFADSNRTGLLWLEGRLVYEEQKNNFDSSDHGDEKSEYSSYLNSYSTSTVHSAPSGSMGNGCSSTMVKEENDNDSDTRLSDFLSGHSLIVVNSNIAQLARQRLDDGNESNDSYAQQQASSSSVDQRNVTIVDSPRIEFVGRFPFPTDNNSPDNQDKAMGMAADRAQQFGGATSLRKIDTSNLEDFVESTPNVDFETTYTSFKFWQPSLPDTLPPLAPPSGKEETSSSNETEQDVGVEVQSFMERHLMFSAVAPLSSEEKEVLTTPAGDNNASGPSLSLTFEKQDVDDDDFDAQPLFVKIRPRLPSDTDDSDSDEAHQFSVVLRKSAANQANDDALKDFDYQDIIPQALLDQFLSMVEPSRAQAIESDISRHCAFNFPAVAFTIGRKHWPLIKPTYLALANDMQWKVRRTLAFSIHNLAAILGSDITVQDLLPVFIGFLRDLDEVRIGILKHLYDFLQLLDKSVRSKLLRNLADFLQTDNYRNWRFRHLFAEQLISLCDLFDVENINEYLSPIAMTLAIDKVAEIRQVTHRLLATILFHFYTGELEVDKDSLPITDSFILDIIKGFAKSQRWIRRQTFLYICYETVRLESLPPQKFAADFLPSLQNLSRDPIPNVRIVLANVFSRLLVSKRQYFEDSPEMAETMFTTMKRMCDDKDRDVRQFAQNFEGDADVSTTTATDEIQLSAAGPDHEAT